MSPQFIRPADGPYAGVLLPIVGIVDGVAYVRIGEHDRTVYSVEPHPDARLYENETDARADLGEGK